LADSIISPLLQVGELATIMAINRNSEPCSRLKLSRWYEKTALPLLTGIKPSEIKEHTLLRTLDYLQEENTRDIQKEIYRHITQRFGIEAGRVYYDLTSTYFEGTNCISWRSTATAGTIGQISSRLFLVWQ